MHFAPLAAGRTYRAYPVGSKYHYKIQKITYLGVGLSETEMSGWIIEFNPNPTRIYCV